MIQFTVFRVPVAQPRTKATIRGGHAGVYTPATTGKGENKKSNGVAELKAAIGIEARQHHKGPLLAGPLRVDVCCVFPRQANKVWKSKPMPRYRKVTKPDMDNCYKLVKDALNGVLWNDDAQVCAGFIQKWHGAGDESPHVMVTVIELEE